MVRETFIWHQSKLQLFCDLNQVYVCGLYSANLLMLPFIAVILAILEFSLMFQNISKIYFTWVTKDL